MKKIVGIIIAIIIVGVLFLNKSVNPNENVQVDHLDNSEEYSNLNEEGLRYMAALDYQMAVETFLKANTIAEGDDLALVNLSNAYLNLGEYSTAVTYIYQALEINHDNNSAQEYIILGKCYELMENYDLAIEVYKKAIEQTADLNIYLKLIHIYENNENYYAYHNTVSEAYKIHPLNYEISWRYGKSLELQGEEDQALTHYRKIGETFSHIPEAIRFVPEYLNKLFKYSESIEYIESLNPLEQDNEFVSLYVNTLLSVRKFDEAVFVADEVIKRKREDYFGYFLKGKILYQSRYYFESIPYFEKAASLQGDYEIFEYELLALYNSNRLYKFQTLAYELLEEFGEKFVIKEHLAYSYSHLKDCENAIKLYNELLENYPATESMKYFLAEVYFLLGDKDKLIQYINNYKTQYNAIDLKVTNLSTYIDTFEKQDVEVVSELFKTYYLYDYDLSVLEGMSGDITDDVITEVFSSITDSKDHSSFVITGENYSYFSNNKSDFEYKNLGKNSHYIDIDSFKSTVNYDFVYAIDKIKNPEESELIIDLRNNSDGLSVAAIEILDSLIGGAIVSESVDKDGNRTLYHSDPSKTDFKHIYILVNHNTASAAELLALGLSEFIDTVTIVGEKTLGIGVGHSVIRDVTNNRAFFIVSYNWYVGNKNIHNVGIVPDVQVEDESIDEYMFELLDLTSF